MIQKLKFSVTFTTGKKLEGEHTFEKGLSAITGPNESGKSFRLEMIRFALFGTKALRAPMATISKLSAHLEFTVNDIAYTIDRTKTNSNLMRNGEQLATGTSPVNAEVIRILGYNMEVFDTTNACLQGKVEALSDKKPTERRRMVDKVIGLEVIDTIISETTSELSGAKQNLASLEIMVNHNLVEPVKPEGVELTAAEYKTKVDSLNEIFTEKFTIDANLKAMYCIVQEMPVAPEGDEDTLRNELVKIQHDLSEAVNINETRTKLQTQIDAIQPVEIEPLQSYILNGVAEKWEKYNAYENKRCSEPGCSESNIEYFERYFEQNDLKSKIAKLEMGNKVTCPDCSHEFHLDHDKINELKAGLDTKIDWQFWADHLKRLNITDKSQLGALRTKVQEYESFIALPVVNKPDQPYNGSNELVQLLIEKQHQRAKYIEELQALPTQSYEDIKRDLNIRLNLVKSQLTLIATYKEQAMKVELNNKRAGEYLAYKLMVQTRLEELEDVRKEMQEVEHLRNAAFGYEVEMAGYKAQVEQNLKLLAQINQVSSDIEQLNLLRKALNEVKPRVKQYLVPSLNRVASNLLSQMTSGARTKVVIDEEFNINIDDQPIDTLSGSGKAVANLAIRIGLGTVLTNKVFSVFLADEIDASMDQDRVAYTAECLKNLTKTIGQIILVSHKKPDADHQIEL